MLDLWETNRNQLLMAGLLPQHIELPGICTGCETHRFYSHRAEHGKAGRFPSIIALRNAG
jgi:copper oxidase (laccase) domain-containing protein